MSGQTAWREVKISAHIIHWPKTCACCGGSAETAVQVTHERTKGVRVVRTEEKSWHIPYCLRCLGHITAKTKLENLQRETSRTVAEADAMHRHAMSMDTSAWWVIAVGVVTGLLIGTSGMCCGLAAAPAAGSGQTAARAFLILLTAVLDLGILAGFSYLVYVLHQKAMVKERAQKRRAIANAEQRVEGARQATKHAQGEEEKYRRLFTSTCTCSDIAAHYLGWHGSIHTFQFSNPSFIAAFAAENKGKML